MARMMYPKVVKFKISEAGFGMPVWLKDVDGGAEGDSCVNELYLARRTLLGWRECQVEEQSKRSETGENSGSVRM